MYVKRGDQDGGIGGYELTSPNKHKKRYLHMEKFLLKTNWKLTERLLYNQG